MAKLTFSHAALSTLLSEAKAQSATTLSLVGDHGIYFMNPGQSPQRSCIYAKGCNPDTDEDWYERKRATFGGDDGVETFSVTSIESWLNANNGTPTVTLAITSRTVRLLVAVHKAPPA